MKVMGLPKHMTVLDLSSHNLEAFPDLSGLNHVTTINLQNNQIISINASYIPESTEELNVQNNKIEVIPDLSALNKLKQI